MSDRGGTNGALRWAQVSGFAAASGVLLTAFVLGVSSVRASAQLEVRMDDIQREVRGADIVPRMARIETKLEAIVDRLCRIEAGLDRDRGRNGGASAPAGGGR